MKKKILILAGTHFQIPVIEYAKQKGYHVITCDNRPLNHGHRYADEYYNVSTTDLNEVLNLASREKINGILAFGSDPAAMTAAYVSEKLNLPGNSIKSVSILSDKGRFRKFLKDNDFPVPLFKVFKSYDKTISLVKIFKKEVYVKPVDSSGSKGISKLKPTGDFRTVFGYAMQFSRKGEVIIEEEIERKGPHIHGEAFILNGELVFLMLGDQYFSPVTVTAPMSTTVPSMFHSDIMSRIERDLVKIIKVVGFTNGGLNIEVIRDMNDKIYFMEIGARSGGNFMPDLITMATGFKIAEANVNAVLGEPIDITYNNPNNKYYTQLIIHSHANGILQEYNFNPEYNENIRLKIDYYNKGDFIQKYKDSRTVIGVYLYEFEKKTKCLDFINYIQNNSLVKLGKAKN